MAEADVVSRLSLKRKHTHSPEGMRGKRARSYERGDSWAVQLIGSGVRPSPTHVPSSLQGRLSDGTELIWVSLQLTTILVTSQMGNKQVDMFIFEKKCSFFAENRCLLMLIDVYVCFHILLHGLGKLLGCLVVPFA